MKEVLLAMTAEENSRRDVEYIKTKNLDLKVL